MDKPKKDDIIELRIDDIGSEGKGVGRINGDFVVFVPNTVPGDLIKAKVRKTKKNYSEALVEEVISGSPMRTTPECEYFGTCNGCRMQNINYDFQLEIKKKSVINAFERIGGFKDLKTPDVIGSKNIYFYRNKLEFSFSNNRWLTQADMNSEGVGKSFALGYHIPGFIDKVLDLKKCYLQSEISNRILNLTRDFFKSKGTSIYSTKTHSGYLRFLVIRQSANSKGLMVNLITHTNDKNLIIEYSEHLISKVPEITTLINSISSSKSQVAQADQFNIIFGNGYIEEKIGKYTFKVTPGSFFQTNSLQCEKLFDTVIELGDFTKQDNVLDLYCGCGAISIYVSGYINKAFGVELNNESIQIAHENSELNKVMNCDFASYDVKDYLKVIKEEKKDKFSTFILDPPRSGIHPKAAEYILEYEPEKIIYVSCNPATQARDLQLLSSKYIITKIQPVDMFPHTYHIENVVRLD